MRNIFPQLFDVRPRGRDGEVDIEKIRRVEAVLRLARVEFDPGREEPIEPVHPVTPWEPRHSGRKGTEGIHRFRAGSNGVQVVPRVVPADVEAFTPLLSDATTVRLTSSGVLPRLPARGEGVTGLTADQILAELTAIYERDEALCAALVRERISVVEPPAPVRRPSPEPDSTPEPSSFFVRPVEAPVAEEPEWLPAPHPSVPPAAAPFPFVARALVPQYEPTSAPSVWPARSVRRRELKYFVAAVLGLGALLVGLGFAGRAMAVKAVVEARVLAGFERLTAAETSIRSQDFVAARTSFLEAAGEFRKARASLGWSGHAVLAAARFWPLPSAAQDASRVLDLGDSIAAAGADLTGIAERAFSGAALRSFLGETDGDLVGETVSALDRAEGALDRALAESEHISADRFPLAARGRFVKLKALLSIASAGVRAAKDEFNAWAILLGAETPRRYLLLFQNPSELRPTGGFIGTYAVMQFDRGQLRELTVNGIFDPDGQLSVKVVPPHPVKRVSTAWSTHDANWFFDYPTSAKKVAWFFGKTGEPTVDGVIAFTPQVIVRLLAITGSIEMPAYGEVVSAENFIEVVQREVELEYDRTANRPKQFLADLVPQLIERLKALDRGGLAKVAGALTDSLAGKDILVYLTDPDRQADMVRRGFAGAVAETSGDYLAVVHTNLNGYKSDYVTDDELTHEATVAPDGSVVDTVTIRRTHRGGATPYFFWNQVNAEWLRVYVPKGSELISVEGATRSELADPIDYDAAGFRRDPEVVAAEATERTDPASGTVISEESQKTVFGNWVFVSPGKTVTVTYRYRLPWTLRSGGAYTLVWQKQPGTNARFIQRVRADGWRMDGEAEQNGVLEHDVSTSVQLSR